MPGKVKGLGENLLLLFCWKNMCQPVFQTLVFIPGNSAALSLHLFFSGQCLISSVTTGKNVEVKWLGGFNHVRNACVMPLKTQRTAGKGRKRTWEPEIEGSCEALFSGHDTVLCSWGHCSYGNIVRPVRDWHHQHFIWLWVGAQGGPLSLMGWGS